MKHSLPHLLASIVFFGSPLFANAQTWDGGGSNSNWSTADNWNPNTAPVNNGTANVVFAGSSGLTPNVDTPWSVNQLAFNSASNFSLGGSAITLQSNSTGTLAAVRNFGAALQTVNSAIVFGITNGDQQFNAQVGSLSFTNTVTTGANRLTLNGPGNISLSGAISGSGRTVGGVLTSIQSVSTFTGQLTLSGNNTFAGTVIMLNGALVVAGDAPKGAAGALGNSSQAIMLGNTSANADNTPSMLINGAHTVARDVVLSNNYTNTIAIGGNSAHTSTYSGTISLGTTAGRLGTLTAATSGTVRFTGNIVGGGSDNADAIEKTGAGTVVLSGAGNTYSGTTAVNQGTLLVNSNFAGSGGAISVAANATLGGTATVDRSVSVAANGILLAGDGTLGSTLTLSNNLTLSDGAVISLALGAAGTHSALARTGGTWSLDSDQAFSFLDLGATVGIYTNIVTGLAANPGVSGWTITNAGWAGTFSYDAGNVSLNLSAVPEPSTWMLLVSSLLFVTILARKRRVAGRE